MSDLHLYYVIGLHGNQLYNFQIDYQYIHITD